jgi:hypothetical protein
MEQEIEICKRAMTEYAFQPQTSSPCKAWFTRSQSPIRIISMPRDRPVGPTATAFHIAAAITFCISIAFLDVTQSKAAPPHLCDWRRTDTST